MDCRTLAEEVLNKAVMLEARACEMQTQVPPYPANEVNPKAEVTLNKASALVQAARQLREAVGVLANVVIDTTEHPA